MRNRISFMIRNIITTLMIAMIVIANPVIANAAISSDTSDFLENYESYDKLPADLKKLIKKENKDVTTKDTNEVESITVGKETWYYADADSDVINKKVEPLIEAQNATDKVTTITDELDLDPDTDKATYLLRGVTPIIKTFLGLAVILITVFMTVFSAFDITYIVFPATRSFLENTNEKSKIQIVTDDAMFAIKSASIESGKSPMSVYLGRRIVSYIILSIMLFIILTGNISLITNLALKIVSGLLEILVSA